MASEGLRLSPQQKHLWSVMTRSGLRSRPYLAQVAVGIRGDLDPTSLEGRLREAVGRHEILRTRFPRRVGFKEPVQIVVEDAAAHWRRADGRRPWSDAADLLDREGGEGFDLEQGPAVRALLAPAGDGEELLVLTAPALVADGRSLINLLSELLPETGLVPDPDPVQYFEFSEWQHGILEDEEADEGARFWRDRLAPGWETLSLAGMTRGSGAERFRPRRVRRRLDAGPAERLWALGEELGASPEALLLTCWLALLARLGGRPDPATGWLVSARDHEELLGAVGPMAWYVPVSPAPVAGSTLSEAVARTAAVCDEAAAWKEHWSGAGPDRSPEVGFSFQHWPRWAGRGSGCGVTVLEHSVCSDRFAAELAAWRHEGPLHLDLRFDPSRFERSRAEELVERFHRLLDRLAERNDPATASLEAIDLMEERERRRVLVELNATERKDYPLGRTVDALFREQVRSTPEAVAVIAGGREVTYAELAERSHAIARRLGRERVGPDAVVALFMPRSLDLVASVLGTLQAGGAFLPLDPDDPQGRIAGILEDAAPAAVLTVEALRSALPEGGPAPVVLPLAEPWADGVDTREPEEPDADNLAYVIFTSGSTGRPKGVAVPHRGLVNYLCWSRETYPLGPGGRLPLHSSVAFDLSLTALLLPLVTGGAVELVADGEGLEGLVEVLQRSAGGRSETDLVKMTPSHMEVLSASRGWAPGSGPGAMIVGGEALDAERVGPWRRRRPSLRLFNEYGPTETVIGCCVHELPEGEPEPGPVPIGRPIANTRIYVLRDDAEPVPDGVPGELCIAGAGLARGYLGRPALTAERFVPDPHGAEPGSRMYRSGDLGSHLPSGALRYLGRNDDQVKIRGIRVELGEAEAALRAHPAVRDAVVVAPPSDDGSRRLVAYLTYSGESRPSMAALRDFLGERLIEVMIPAQFVVLDGFPLTPSGKVDRRALPDPGSERPDTGEDYVAPRNRKERVLTEIFADALDLDRVGARDSFFGLGGDSIRCVRVVALARERGLELTVPDMFRFQTAAELAAHIGEDERWEGPDEEAELSELLDELDELSEDEVRRRLHGRRAGGGTGG